MMKQQEYKNYRTITNTQQPPTRDSSMNNEEFFLFAHRRKNRPWYQRYLLYYRWRLMRLRERPEKLAKGLAVGAFAGCFPLFGIQIIIAILLALIVRGNKFAAMMGTWISNPFTYVPIFWFNFEVGQLILHLSISDIEPNQIEFNWDSWQSLADQGLEIIFTLLVGSFFVGMVISCLVYYVTLRTLKKKNQK